MTSANLISIIKRVSALSQKWFSDLVVKRRTPLFRLSIEKEGGRLKLSKYKMSKVSRFSRKQEHKLTTACHNNKRIYEKIWNYINIFSRFYVAEPFIPGNYDRRD